MYDFEMIVDRRGCGSYKWDAIAAEMGEGAEDVTPMSVADMELKTAPEITEALKKAVDFGVYGYTGPTEGYYEAVQGWMERRHGWKIKKDWISLSPGVVSAFYNAIRALTHPGDKVIIQRPVYYPFSSAVKLSGCEIVNNPLILKDGRYEMDFEDLEQKAKDPRVKVLLFCNPHNPVGRVWTAEELKKLGEICLKNNVVVVSDEIHFDFVFKPFHHTVFATISPEMEQNCMILTAPSKTFNLAGLQCSNIIIPNPELKAAFDLAFENTGTFSLNYFAYPACEAAYRSGEGWLDGLLELLESNKKILADFLADELPQIKLIEPEGTYLAWLDCRGLKMNRDELETFMKQKARVFFDEGYLFGEEGNEFERINLACPEKMLKKVLENIKAAIKRT
ncbi:MAG TPA: MalY/PatB family protein [Clostridia bacterium]|nr:MalY/PatB family protein [Clostridia bacterium]